MYDHVRYHDTATSILKLQGWDKRLETPKWSPDFDKAVEHAHGVIKNAVRSNPNPLTKEDGIEKVKERITEAAQRCITRDGIERDYNSFRVMWKVIANAPSDMMVAYKGKEYKCTNGDWPHKDLR